MLIRDNEITTQQTEELRKLLTFCFDEAVDSAILKTTLRAIYVDTMIVGHAAVDVRRIIFHSVPAQIAFLGFVCVQPEYRGRGIGQMLITELHQAISLPFLLNCGSSVVPYYSRLGYVLIADAASYDRKGLIEIDHDPVMGFSNGLPVSMEFQNEPVHFGLDF